MMYPGAHTVDQSDPVTQLEADWRLWRLTLFPSYLTDALGRIVPDGPHHLRFWEWVWQIRKGHRAPAFVGIWPRGGGKSTNVEMATVALGALQTRRYGWYTCATQDQADGHVASIGSMLESPEVGAFYPALSARRVGKYGHSRGWRGNRLTTAAGFTVDAVGLDKAIRGRRMIEDRPHLIILHHLHGPPRPRPRRPARPPQQDPRDHQEDPPRRFGGPSGGRHPEPRPRRLVLHPHDRRPRRLSDRPDPLRPDPRGGWPRSRTADRPRDRGSPLVHHRRGGDVDRLRLGDRAGQDA